MSAQRANSDSHIIYVPASLCSNTSTQTDTIEKKPDIKVYKIKEVVALTLLTYLATSAVFYSIGNDSPLLNAFVPTTGYFISTLESEKMLNLAQRIISSIQSCFSFLSKKIANTDGTIPINQNV